MCPAYRVVVVLGSDLIEHYLQLRHLRTPSDQQHHTFILNGGITVLAPNVLTAPQLRIRSKNWAWFVISSCTLTPAGMALRRKFPKCLLLRQSILVAQTDWRSIFTVLTEPILMYLGMWSVSDIPYINGFLHKWMSLSRCLLVVTLHIGWRESFSFSRYWLWWLFDYRLRKRIKFAWPWKSWSWASVI